MKKDSFLGTNKSRVIILFVSLCAFISVGCATISFGEVINGKKQVVLLRGKPLAQQLVQKHTIYSIRDDFDLGGTTVLIPEGCELRFDGGSIRNGILKGELHLPTGFIKASEIGIKSNENGLGQLRILSEITTPVKIKIDIDFYLSGKMDYTLGDIHIDGNGHTVILKDFDGIKVDGDVVLENTRVNALSDRGSYFFKLQENKHKNPCVLIKDNIVQGNVMMIRSYNYCLSDFQHYESVKIENNTFNNVYFIQKNAGIASRIFSFSNTQISNTILKNNVVHNFFGLFFDFGITNGTIYESSIPSSCKKNGRKITIENNIVYNDLGLTWDDSMSKNSTYFCFALIERGDCMVRNNEFSNIIRTDNTGVAYDNYLSVDRLKYTNNVWKNCFSLKNQGNYNVLMKCKSNGDKRIYENNKYIVQDLSAYYSGFDKFLIAPNLIHAEKDWDLTIDNNIFDLAFFRIKNNANRLAGGHFVFNQNFISIEEGFVDPANPAIFDLGQKTKTLITSITNNYFNLVKSDRAAYLVSSPDLSPSQFSKTCIIKNNVIKNFRILVGLAPNKKTEIQIEKNKVYPDAKLLNYKDNKVVFEENSVFSDPHLLDGLLKKRRNNDN